MKPAKKVEFLERIEKSYLGLEGMQIVVNCDKSNNNTIDKKLYDFQSVGEKCFREVTAKKVSEKYGLLPGIELGKKLHEERVNWIKNLT